jgi:hypothetical protein
VAGALAKIIKVIDGRPAETKELLIYHISGALETEG